MRQSDLAILRVVPKPSSQVVVLVDTVPGLVVNVRQRPPMSGHVHAGCHSVSHSSLKERGRVNSDVAGLGRVPGVLNLPLLFPGSCRVRGRGPGGSRTGRARPAAALRKRVTSPISATMTAASAGPMPGSCRITW